MSKNSTKIIGALLVLLAAPAASYARMAGEAGMGNIPISGIPPGPANPGGMNNVIVEPSRQFRSSSNTRQRQRRVTAKPRPGRGLLHSVYEGTACAQQPRQMFPMARSTSSSSGVGLSMASGSEETSAAVG